MTCDKFPEREQNRLDFLIETGIDAERYSGKITTPYTLGIRDAWLDVLKNNSLPLLIAEDDIKTTGNWKSVISVPVGADALHYSSSLFGRLGGQTVLGGVVWSEFDDMWVKVENLLSFHLILILSERYKNHIISLFEQFDGLGGLDDSVGDAMKNFNVYAAKFPPVYQADNHSEFATKTSLIQL